VKTYDFTDEEIKLLKEAVIYLGDNSLTYNKTEACDELRKKLDRPLKEPRRTHAAHSDPLA